MKIYLDSQKNNQISAIEQSVNEITDLLYTKESLNVIYVDANLGNDKNTGEENSPVKTAQKAFQLLCNLGSKTLFNQWKIKFNPGTYTYAKISNLPQFSKQLIIEGTRDDNNEITSIFQCDGTNYIGLWFEPVRGNSIQIKDLKFVGYKKGFNGYGVIGKDQGELLVVSCEADDCDCGFAGVNNVTLNCQKTIARNSAYGFKSLYCSAATIGAGTGGKHMSDGGNGCEAYNCDVGFFISRNSVAHSDYVKYFNCNTGVRVEMNSRLATLSNVFSGCTVNGVEVQGGAEWVGGTDNEIDIWENCTTPYTMQGNARYARLQSLYCKTESLFVCKTEKELLAEGPVMAYTPSVTGTTTKTLAYRMSPTICIPPYYLDSEFTRIRVVVRGLHKTMKDTNNTINATFYGLNPDNSLDGNSFGVDATIPTESPNLSGFCVEYEFTFKKFNDNGTMISDYQRTVDVYVGQTTGGNRVQTLTYAPARPNVSNKQQLRIVVTPSSAENEVTIRQIDVYVLN